MIKYNGTIHDMVREIEESIRDNKDREETLRSRIQFALDRAESRGQKSLDPETDAKCEKMFSEIESLKAARKVMNSKLARAREVAAEEDEAEARLNERMEVKRNATTSSTREFRADGFGPDGRPDFDRHASLVYGYGGSYESERSGDSWLRSTDGRSATVARGQRFADHTVVRDAMARESQRDRHIVGQHGDFVHMVRAMTTTSGAGIVPTVWSANIIDLARNASVMFQAGAQLVPMDAKVVQIGRLTGDPAPAFKTEGTAITAGDVSFDYIQLNAVSLGALVVCSMEFLQDAPQADSVIQEALAKSMALQIDKIALFGQLGSTGTNDEGASYAFASPNPKGLLKTLIDVSGSPNVLGFATNGTAQTTSTPWTEMLSVVYKPLRANEKVSAIVSNTALVQQYDGMVDSTYQPLRKPEAIANVPWLQTNAIPSYTRGSMTSRATDVFAGDFSQVLIGQRLGLEIKVLTERYAENGQIGLLAYWRGDVQVARPGALACYRAIQGAA
jgi:HK97 family phage major capsid protein